MVKDFFPNRFHPKIEDRHWTNLDDIEILCPPMTQSKHISGNGCTWHISGVGKIVMTAYRN